LIKENNLSTTFTSTGTTILGFHFEDGLILAADTRATAGMIVADKNCVKIEQVADNIYICGAGTAADCSHVKFLMRS
jgi:20S proteasome subunit beta 2